MNPNLTAEANPEAELAKARQHNIAIEHGPLDDLPWFTYTWWFSIVMLNSQRLFWMKITSIDEHHQLCEVDWADQVQKLLAEMIKSQELMLDRREMSRDVESHEASHATHAMNDGYWCQLVYYGLLW